MAHRGTARRASEPIVTGSCVASRSGALERSVSEFNPRAASTYGVAMYLENVVFDALAPRELGRFWEAVVGGEQLTDEPAGYETRLAVPGGPELDLCFQPVPEPAVG